MVGNRGEVVDSIRETAEQLSGRNSQTHELAEACLGQGRDHAKRIAEMDERDQARDAIMDAQRRKRQQEMGARQDQAAIVAAKEVRLSI